MKILNLKIISPEGEIVRNIVFNENGISIILGNILEPENKKKTSNSLGKSLLLKFIDYIYGANNDSKTVPEDLYGYVLKAIIKFKDKEYEVVRKLEPNSSILIDNESYTHEEYKKYFEIDRELFHKQIVLYPRGGLISYTKYPIKSDMINFLKLINLEELVDMTDKIYSGQDEIKKLKDNKEKLLKFLNQSDKIDENIFLLKKDIEKLEKDVAEISGKIRTLQTSDIKENIIEEYERKNIEFKELKQEIFINNTEIERMKKFLKEYEDVDVSSKSIFNLYKKAKVEVPELIKRKIEDVESFHKNVYDDRKEFLEERIEYLNGLKEKNNEKLAVLKENLNYLGNIISENKIYKENIELYDKYSHELKDKKYQQGQFSQVENVNAEINAEDDKLVTYFNNLKQMLSEKNNENKIEEIRNFVYDFIQNIYNYERKDTKSYFNLEVRKKQQKNRPFNLDIKIDYDRGEGVGQVKKIMTDILILKFNKLLDFFIQDSSSYVGVDPRQVTTILMEIDKISICLKKQTIISINKYQVLDSEETLEFLDKKQVIKLSENDKLLKYDFE